MKDKPRFLLPPAVIREVVIHFGSHRQAGKALGRVYYFWRARGFRYEKGRDKALKMIQKKISNGNSPATPAPI